MQKSLLLKGIPKRIVPMIFYHVRILSKYYQFSSKYNPQCSVDKWRVVIKGENPDYINASVAHVGYICVSKKRYYGSLIFKGIQAAESLHHSPESYAIHGQRLLEDDL